jgi:hypothetical protein
MLDEYHQLQALGNNKPSEEDFTGLQLVTR